MLFITTIAAIALAGLVTLVTAQTNTTGGEYYIDPNSVPISTRDSWCTSQTASCPLICLQVAPSNSTIEFNNCNATTLTYTCICGNGASPDASEYSNSLPYFICSEWGTQCVTACAANSTCASACRQNHPCGAINPVRVNTFSSSSSVGTTASVSVAATTSSSGGTTSGSSGDTTAGGSSISAATATSSATVKSGDVAVFQMGEAYGLLIVAASLSGGFAFFL